MNDIDKTESGQNQQEQEQEENYSIVAEFWDFLKHSKRWWLLPIVIILALLSVLILVTSSSPVFPMIYAMF